MSWQYLPFSLSPYIIQTPWFSLHWYGFMYAFAYVLIYLFARYRMRTEVFKVSKDQLLGAMTWSIIGLAIGARAFYVIFYEPGYYLAHPFQIVWPFDVNGSLIGISGLSYHGGLVGIIIAVTAYCRSKRLSVWELSDLLLPIIPLGYAFGRIGNFINGELYGRLTTVPWGMYFPRDSEKLLRHPSQLYESALEGVLIFVILWMLRKHIKGPRLLGLYLLLYAMARITCEFFREPDPQLGFIFGPFTMGQLLSAGMIMAGAILCMVSVQKTKLTMSNRH